MHLIAAAILPTDTPLPEIWIRADRFTLAKRRWRGVADDGADFGFELEAPVKHGDVVFQSSAARYLIVQAEEPVVEIALDLAPSAAAGIGWAIGNLHLELSAEATRMLAPDEPAVRQLLTRLRVPFRQTTAVFQPGRFARGPDSNDELGPSHKH